MRKPIGKRPKNLEVSKRPKNEKEQIESDALHDILQVGAHHARYSNFQKMTIGFWYLFAERLAQKIESDPKASDELRAIVANYRRHVQPLDSQTIIAQTIESLTK